MKAPKKVPSRHLADIISRNDFHNKDKLCSVHHGPSPLITSLSSWRSAASRRHHGARKRGSGFTHWLSTPYRRKRYLRHACTALPCQRKGDLCQRKRHLWHACTALP